MILSVSVGAVNDSSSESKDSSYESLLTKDSSFESLVHFNGLVEYNFSEISKAEESKRAMKIKAAYVS